MATQNDIETARELGNIKQWRVDVDQTLREHGEKIGELVQCQQDALLTRKAVRFAMFAALSIAIVVLLGGCLLLSPSDVKKILPLLIGLIP